MEAYWLEEVVRCADRAHGLALAGQMDKAREEAGSLIELVRKAFGELGMPDPLGQNPASHSRCEDRS